MNHHPDSVSDGEVQIQQIDPGLAEQMAGAQIDRLIETAKRFPRSIATVKKQATELATIDVDSASGCTYSIPRGNKTITGPSIKFAKIIASCWGNLWIQVTPIAEDRRFVTVRAVAWDVEKNVCFAVDVKRRIVDSRGNTFNDDMIGVTTMAAASIAFRNSVLLIVPDAFTNSIHMAAREVARGDATTLQERRDKMFAHFASMGVDDQRIFYAVGVQSRDEIGLGEFEILLGIANAIKFDGMDIDTVFPNIPSPDAPAPGGTKTEQLAEKLRQNKASRNGAPDAPDPKEDPKSPEGSDPAPSSPGEMSDEEKEAIKRQEKEEAEAEAARDAPKPASKKKTTTKKKADPKSEPNFESTNPSASTATDDGNGGDSAGGSLLPD